MTMLICPACEQIHVDEGVWAKKPHKTHRCVRGLYGLGCGNEWEAREKGFGTDEIGDAYQRGLAEGLEEALRVSDAVVTSGLLNNPLPSLSPTRVKEARDDMLAGIHKVNAAVRLRIEDLE